MGSYIDRDSFVLNNAESPYEVAGPVGVTVGDKIRS